MAVKLNAAVTNPRGVLNWFSQASILTDQFVNEELMNFADDLKDEFVETSPVDTGQYKRSWYVQPMGRHEVHVLNSASRDGENYAQYVMHPNVAMIGSSKADVPSAGILHNVKGIAHRKQAELSGHMNVAIERVYSG